jgi:hypothetical protein
MTKKMGRAVCVSFLCVLLTLGFALSPQVQAEEIEITIDVAPNVLNIASSGTWVTVHTDIAYSAVEGATVSMNGVAIDWWKADLQGNFVAKFVIDEIKAIPGLIIRGYNTLVLEGATTTGDVFSGAQAIKVIDVVPSGRLAR